MAQSFKYFARKFARCKYEDPSTIIWSSFVYKISYKKVLDKGLRFIFAKVPKLRVEGFSTYPPLELYEEKVRSKGYYQVWKTKQVWLSKGARYEDGFWYYVSQGKVIREEYIEREQKKESKVNFVHLSWLRDLEMIMYGHVTSYHYESCPGGAVILNEKYYQVYEFDCKEYVNDNYESIYGRYAEYFDLGAHVMFLRTAITIEVVGYGQRAKVFVANENEVEDILVLANLARHPPLNVVGDYKINQEKEVNGKVKFNLFINHVDISTRGIYRVKVSAPGCKIKIRSKISVLVTEVCFRDDDFKYMPCSCGKNSIEEKLCVNERHGYGKCLPFSLKECQSCEREREFYILAILNSKQNKILSSFNLEQEKVKEKYIIEQKQWDIWSYNRFVQQRNDLMLKIRSYERKYKCRIIYSNGGFLFIGISSIQISFYYLFEMFNCCSENKIPMYLLQSCKNKSLIFRRKKKA